MTREKEPISSKQLPVYRPAGFYMLRAPILPADIFKRLTSNPMTDPQGNSARFTQIRQSSYDTLKKLSATPLVQHALLIASVDMLEGLERINREDATPKRIERVYSSILRYLVRMSTRTTPFGLFSGVAVGTFAEQSTMQMGTPTIQSTRSRPDMGWLLSLIQSIEENPDLFPYLSVRANHTVYIAGTRVIIPYADVYGKGDNRSITLRATEVVQYVMQQAREPISYQRLRQDILAAFPFATEQQVDSLLRQLWQHHFLISDLRPPLTGAKPEKYVLERLFAVPQAALVTAELEKVIQNVEKIDSLEPGAGLHLLQKEMANQRALISEETRQPIQVDTALRLETPQLNSEIGAAVADVAEVLLRMTYFPAGPQHLREYFTAFAERYGMNVEVPLLDLLSPELGLGAPGTYTEPPRDFPFPSQVSPKRPTNDAVLCSLLAETLYQQKTEVELTDKLVQALTQWTPGTGNLPPSTLEIYLQLHAPSRAAFDQGEWRGVLTNQSYGGRTLCRFFDVLDEEGLRMLQTYAKQEEALEPEVIFAELSYLPTFGRGANVVIRPALRSYEIILNATPSVSPEQVIPLQDLVVGIKGDRFYIRSISRKKEVKVTQSHMLNVTRAPNVCRFLIEVSQDGRPMPTLFGWGSANNAPFLPRVVRKKMVLCPAQWNLRLSMIQPIGQGDEEERFFAGVQQWREQWRVPRYVYMAEFDNRLLLDLEHPLLVAELSKELKKKTADAAVLLQEMLPDFEHLWLRDQSNAPYMAELVVPLIVNTEAGSAYTNHKEMQNWQQEYPKRVILDRERSFLPGDVWTYLKLYVPLKQQDEIIAGPLCEIIQKMQQKQLIDQWFFIRYADPEPHLRVRFHASNEQTKNVLFLTALNWGRQLVQAGLLRNIVVDTYSREIERYGGPQAISVLEDVFTANSLALAEIIGAMYRSDITLDPLIVNVFTLDQFFSMWGLDLSERLLFIQKQTSKHAGKESFRTQRSLLCELLMPWDPHYDPALREQRELLLRLCLLQEPILQRASAHIKKLAANGDLWVQEQQILASLAHMHSNRLLGVSRDTEQQGYAFWRHTLESICLRPARKEPKDAYKSKKFPAGTSIERETEKNHTGNAFRH